MRNLLCFDWFLYARDFGHDKIVVSSIPAQNHRNTDVFATFFLLFCLLYNTVICLSCSTIDCVCHGRFRYGFIIRYGRALLYIILVVGGAILFVIQYGDLFDRTVYII